MTYPTAPATAAPIVANASPLTEQIAAGIRQAILVAAAIATALGYAHAAGEISAFLMVAAPLAGLVVIILGQLKTRQSSQNVATLAAIVPDSVAVVKATGQ